MIEFYILCCSLVTLWVIVSKIGNYNTLPKGMNRVQNILFGIFSIVASPAILIILFCFAVHEFRLYLRKNKIRWK